MTSPILAFTTKITTLLSASPSHPILVALDGRCGSGKTTLAAQLAEAFPDSITVHTDDYYLPPADRVRGGIRSPAPTWTLPACGRRCWSLPGRGSHFFIKPTPAGRARTCRRVACAPTRLVLVEGSYSHHPSLAACYDLRIFVTCSKAEQARRLQAREGARYAAFVERWVPLEEAYFAKYAIEPHADLILDTEKGMIVP